MINTQQLFETWAIQEGISTQRSVNMESNLPRLFPATYWDSLTEMAWRAWANKPSNCNSELSEIVPELLAALQWYVDEDEINEFDPENKYWTDGKHDAMDLIARVTKEQQDEQ